MNSSEVLRKSILELYKCLRKGMRQKWKRDLPFEEMIFDRWERAGSLGFGEGSSIYHNCYVYGHVSVGKNTWIGPYTLLDGSGGLSIGDYCSISAGVHIYTHDTVKWALSCGNSEYERAPVGIGNCCHIGAQTVITKGVTIGDHCVIGACSFVNRDIPSGTIAIGTPCKPAGVVKVDDSGMVELVYDIDF
ncbi:MAG: acyltransferase [Deltaproteobacteria bacterium]|nr:acyltransferase [Deltaproteobacteria bacterium]